MSSVLVKGAVVKVIDVFVAAVGGVDLHLTILD